LVGWAFRPLPCVRARTLQHELGARLTGRHIGSMRACSCLPAPPPILHKVPLPHSEQVSDKPCLVHEHLGSQAEFRINPMASSPSTLAPTDAPTFASTCSRPTASPPAGVQLPIRRCQHQHCRCAHSCPLAAIPCTSAVVQESIAGALARPLLCASSCFMLREERKKTTPALPGAL